MSPSVVELVSVIKYDRKKHHKDSHNGRCMDLEESLTPDEAVAKFVLFVLEIENGGK
jgi:hypothetical protein